MVGKNRQEDNVLYELLVYSEWRQEPEVWKNKVKLADTSPRKSLYLFNVFNQALWPAEEITRLAQLLLPWQIAVSEDGKIVAVLQETTLEIRTSRDDFTSIVGKAIVFKDPAPQWRKMEWSSDCSMLAISSSSGFVYVYDLLGSHLFTIPCPNEQPRFSEVYTASLIFIKARTKNPKWPLELLVIRYNGVLNSYYVSTTDGYLEAHSIILSKNGISAAASYPNHNLLFVALKPQHTNSETHGHSVGLSTWRLLNDVPYFKMVSPTPEQLNDYSTSKMIQSWFHLAKPISYIFKMTLSPKGRFLSCLHTDGTISIWHAPSLRLHQKWLLDDQETLLPPSAHSDTDDRVKHKHQPIDTEWRADEKLIIARLDGNILVCEVDSLSLCEGSEPEQLSGHPRISSAPSHTGFLAIECEEIFLNGETAVFRKVGNEDHNSFLNTSTELLQSTIYMITDLEKYEPKKRPNKIVQRTYKLLGVKSTTPEELFNRKLDYEDYEEALSLATRYNLDSDRVYQRQWRNSPVKSDTIQNYLSKIKKKSWVLDEFVKRVPETLSGAKELMNFAFSYTDINSINSVKDNGETEIESWVVEDLDPLQKHMISTRIRLIDYSDKLHTYELIITNGHTEDYYDMFQYEKFRNQHIVESAIQFARSGHVKAVLLIIAHHPEETKPYLLNILENFPETLAPSKYSELLPECDGDYNLLSLDQVISKPQDWCKSPKFRYLDEVKGSDHLLTKYGPLYEMNVKTVEEWYKNRISLIEEKTCVLDNALQLLTLAQKRNIKGLEALHADLLTLETLVYNLSVESITLNSLGSMSSLDVAFLLISEATDDDFLNVMLSFVLPYFQRCEHHSQQDQFSLLLKLLTSVSGHNLIGPTKFFRHVIDGNLKLVGDVAKVVNIVTQCIYAYEYFEQLHYATNLVNDVIDWLGPLSKFSSKESWLEHLTELKNELIAVDILQKNYIAKSVLYLHKTKDDVDAMRKLLHQMARTFYNFRYYSAEAEEYNILLNDIILLQSGIFRIIPLNECYEVFILTLLESGSSSMIEFAANVLCCSSNEEYQRNISLERSVALIVQTAREYFDTAVNFNSRSMELAKTCLLLMKEEHKDVQEELDLISSLRLLAEFGINLVPIEVRRTKDRMVLIKKCLFNNPRTYNDPGRIYKLAAKLRVCGTNLNSRHCAVTNCLAESALRGNAFESCAEFCNVLISREQSSGWDICLKLSQCKSYKDLTMKLKLLSFTALHCPSRLLPCVNKIRSELEVELCESKLNKEIQSPKESTIQVNQDQKTLQDDSEELVERKNNSFNPANILLRILSTDFLRRDVSWAQESEGNQTHLEMENVAKFSCPSFYESLFENPHFSTLNSTYEKPKMQFIIIPQLNIYRTLLRASLIDQEVAGPRKNISFEDVSVNCSELTLLEDTALGLSYLLSLGTPELSESCFSNLPKSRFIYQLAIYYYSLYSTLAEVPFNLYFSPQKALQKALAVQNCVCSSMIVKYEDDLNKYIQVEKMKELNCGVNTERFSSDQDYKRDSIFGLAMSEDFEKFKLALEMSLQNNIPGYEVAITHLVSLFLNQLYNLILDRMNIDEFKKLLKEQPETTIHRIKNNKVDGELQLADTATHETDELVKNLEGNTLSKCIFIKINFQSKWGVFESVLLTLDFMTKILTTESFPSMSGFNHQGLITFFSVIKLIQEEEDISGLKPKEHIKLLKKLRSISAEIDYKKLILDKCSVLEVFMPCATSDNIGNLFKLLKGLPPAIKGNISPSAIFLKWAVEQFIHKCLDESLPTKQCVQRFELLYQFLSKLTSEELDTFIHETILSRKAMYTLNYTSRKHILGSLLHWYIQHHSESKEEIDILHTLERNITVINEIWDDEMDPYIMEKLKHHLLHLEEYASNDEKLAEVIVESLFDTKLTLGEVNVIVALSGLQQNLPELILEYCKPAIDDERFKSLLDRIQTFLNIEGESSNEWLTLLKSFIQSLYINKHSKLLAASVIKKFETKHCNDLFLITKSLLPEDWPLDEMDLSDEKTRVDLFNTLLKKSETTDQITCLHNLLLQWPSFSQTEEHLELGLIEALLYIEGDDKYTLIPKIMKNHQLPEEVVVELINRNEKKGDPLALCFVCILTDSSGLHCKALNLIQTMNKVSVPAELGAAIVSKGFLPQMVGMKIYHHITQNLLRLAENDSLIEEAANTLIEANILPEAGSLVMEKNRIPTALRIYDSALFLSQKIKKS